MKLFFVFAATLMVVPAVADDNAAAKHNLRGDSDRLLTDKARAPFDPAAPPGKTDRPREPPRPRGPPRPSFCAADSVFEGEECITSASTDRINDGCNVSPPKFGVIGNLVPVCGRYSRFSGIVDRDYYRFTILEDAVIPEITITSSASFQYGIVGVTPGRSLCPLLEDFGPPGGIGSIAPDITNQRWPVLLPPGDYAIFVGPTPFVAGDVDCAEYTLTLKYITIDCFSLYSPGGNLDRDGCEGDLRCVVKNFGVDVCLNVKGFP